MLGRTSVRSLTTLALIAMLAVVVGLWAQNTAKADCSPGQENCQEVDTSATIGGGGVAPTIECKWELPDMDSTVGGIQYTKAPGHIHDDDMALSPGSGVPCKLPVSPADAPPAMADGAHNMIQVKPNLENLPEERLIQLWPAVDSPRHHHVIASSGMCSSRSCPPRPVQRCP